MAKLEDDVEDRIPVFRAAWEEWAKTEVFAKMNLEEFKIKSEPPLAIRAEILALEQKLSGKLAERDLADAKAGELLALVVSSVKGNPDYGPDCELYQSMGYVRKSERKSGLTRKDTKPPAGGNITPAPPKAG
jgi:hypothetical protein